MREKKQEALDSRLQIQTEENIHSLEAQLTSKPLCCEVTQVDCSYINNQAAQLPWVGHSAGSLTWLVMALWYYHIFI